MSTLSHRYTPQRRPASQSAHWLLLSVLSWLIIALGNIAYAAGSVELQAGLGFNGAYATGYLTPVWVQLQNHGAALSVQLVLSESTKTPQGTKQTVKITRPLRLPQGARQRYELEFPLLKPSSFVTDEGELLLALQTGERTLAQQTISLSAYRGFSNPLFLLLSDRPAPASLPDGRPLLAITSAELPGHWAGYRGVARLYLGRFNLDSLSAAQRGALQNWLRSGGELVVLLGDNWYFQQSKMLAELLPFVPQDLQLSPLDGRDRPISQGQVRGTVLQRSAAGDPLLIRRRFGRGAVYAVTVDLLALGDGPAERALWHALQVAAPDVQSGQPRLGDEILAGLKLVQPSRLILAGALLLYLGGFAALGLLTGRTRRLYLVIALWVGLISLGLLLYLQRPVYTRPLRSIEVGEIWARGDRAFLRDWYSVFALRETKLKLLLAPEVAVRQVASSHDLNWTLTPEQNRLQLKLGREQMAHLLLEQPISFPVTFKVQPAGADVRAPQIDIYNDSDRPLVGAVLWWQGRFYWLGTIGAHDKLQRALEMGLSSFPLSKQDKEFSIKQRLLASAESGFSPEPMALLAWVQQAYLGQLSGEYRRVLQLAIVAGQ